MASFSIPISSSSPCPRLVRPHTDRRIRFPPRRTPAIAAVAGGSGKKAKYVGTNEREKNLEEMIERTVMEAKEVCEGDEESEECRVAWDQVEEVSQAKADLRRRIHESPSDPLESYCADNPEADECRIYED